MAAYITNIQPGSTLLKTGSDRLVVSVSWMMSRSRASAGDKRRPPSCRQIGIASGLVIVRLAERFGRRALLLTGFALAASFHGSVIALSAAQRATDPACQGRVAACFNTLNGLMGLAVYGVVALLPVVLWASRRGRIGPAASHRPIDIAGYRRRGGHGGPPHFRLEC